MGYLLFRLRGCRPRAGRMRRREPPRSWDLRDNDGESHRARHQLGYCLASVSTKIHDLSIFVKERRIKMNKYNQTSKATPRGRSYFSLVHPRGFEPLVSSFGGKRFIRLSYGCRINNLPRNALTSKPKSTCSRFRYSDLVNPIGCLFRCEIRVFSSHVRLHPTRMNRGNG